PGFFANKLGVHNILVTATFVCSVLILGMIGLGSVASVVVIAIIYGFFAGTCACHLAILVRRCSCIDVDLVGFRYRDAGAAPRAPDRR
ncbi:hypothetical protein ACXWPE_09425, partial [Streptococcus pyogenes]